MLKFGDNTIKLKLGETEVTRGYLGPNVVYGDKLKNPQYKLTLANNATVMNESDMYIIALYGTETSLYALGGNNFPHKNPMPLSQTMYLNRLPDDCLCTLERAVSNRYYIKNISANKYYDMNTETAGQKITYLSSPVMVYTISNRRLAAYDTNQHKYELSILDGSFEDFSTASSASSFALYKVEKIAD